MKEGTTFIVDRYSYSGIVYSMANGLEGEWCKKMESGLPKPDVVLFLDLSVEDAAKRGDYGKERYEKRAFQQKVRDNYHSIIEDNWKVNLLINIEYLHQNQKFIFISNPNQSMVNKIIKWKMILHMNKKKFKKKKKK